MPETSIIIRTKNEEKWIGEVLTRLGNQTYKNFETIIVDSGSTDKTLEIIKGFDVRLVQIKPEEFSYPHALNVGCKNATASKYFVFISGHSLPLSNTWLQDGINDFADDLVMGVYGFLNALPKSSVWDKIIMDGSNFLRRVSKGKSFKMEVSMSGMGIMGFTNVIIQKKLWDERKFNEEYGAGGEDGEWVDFWIKKGYRAIKDDKFTVYHSHNLSLRGWIKQRDYWRTLGAPRSFSNKELEFRDSNTFK